MTIETTRWDAADHLGDDEAVIAYLGEVFGDGDPGLIAAALNDVTRARGLGDIALQSNIGLDAVIRTLKSLGLELTAKAA